MPKTRLTGEAAESKMQELIAHSRAAINAQLAPYDPASTFDVWFSTIRGIEELINLPIELQDEALLDRILGLSLLDIDGVVRDLAAIKVELQRQFTVGVASRLMWTLIQTSAIAASFASHGISAARGLRTVGAAIGYFQSRRRHLLALLHTIPKACRGTTKVHKLDGLNLFLYFVETAGTGLTSMYKNLMLARVYPDFELIVDAQGTLANHDFNALDSMFLEPERVAITEVDRYQIGQVDLEPVSDRLIFSAAEVRNNLKLIAAAYSEFNLEATSFRPLAVFIRDLLADAGDDYWIRMPLERMNAVAAAAGLPESVRTRLVADDPDYVENACTYAPFTVVEGQVVTSVTLLSRFAYYWKNACLNRIRRYQIRAGFIFEDTVKAELRRQGFDVTDIKRVGHAEFDVVATLEGVIYNLQCKNNLVDLNRVESDVKRFVRYNRTLNGAYARALEKERAREGILTTKLGLPVIKHFVITRFPVATANPKVLAFGEIRRFRVIAERA